MPTPVVNTFSILVNAAPDKVFTYVSDLTRHGEWSGAPLTVEAVSTGPVAVGSQYRSKGDVAVQKNRPNELRVTDYQPPSRFVFVAQDANFGAVTHEFTFTPKEGGILVTRTISLQMSPLMAFMFKNVISPLIGAPATNRSLAALKAKMENPSA
jgi:uncharacterized protein YndB with AHSA1/START domain